MKPRTLGPAFAAGLSLLVLGSSLACEERTAEEEREEEAEDRRELLESAEEDAADSAEELERRAGNIPDAKDDPETAEELKEETGLHDEDEK